MQNLAKEGLVQSLKGPQGGFCLSRDTMDITLYDIVKAIDGTEAFHTCIIRAQPCDENNPCALHNYWRKNLTQARTILDNVTLDDLVKDMHDGKRVLQYSDDTFTLNDLKKQLGII